jgi:hypothetical protein
MTLVIIRFSNDELSSDLLTEIINYLIKCLDEVKPGNEDASKYHRLVVGILELLFYPKLTSPIVEKEIHSGNTYQISSQFIFFECKNYTRDIKNPELDQISGRFSPNRGKFGIILCRSIDKFKHFINRCRDTYKDQRGLIIPLVDDDLISMLMNYEKNGVSYCEEILAERFRDIALD